jgi:RNA polymerase primary sigma factor
MQDGLAGELKKLIALAQARGYITYEELNQAMPSTDYTSEQIEDITAMFQEKGIALVEFPEGYEPREAEPVDRETACQRSVSRIETALAALRHGRIRFACQLLEATSAELRPFTED